MKEVFLFFSISKIKMFSTSLFIFYYNHVKDKQILLAITDSKLFGNADVAGTRRECPIDQ